MYPNNYSNNYKNYSYEQIIQQQNKQLDKLNNILNKHSNVKNVFQNTRYHFNLRDSKTLIIHHDIGNNTTFELDLQKPLIIDRLCDVYLEHFTTFNSYSDFYAGYFLLDIDQFNIKNSTNDDLVKNRILIPNEASTNGITKTHKSKKLNYICSINPTKLTKISGSLTDAYGDSIMFVDENSNENPNENATLAFVAEFLFIPRKDN